jgi:D-alanine-D-alanine ligase
MTPRKKVLVLTFVSAPIRDEAGLKSSLKGEPDWVSEHDVLKAVRKLGHQGELAVVYDDIQVVRAAVEEHRPDVVFNLCDAFRGDSTNDYKVAAYLDTIGVAYTGCGPKGLLLSKDKGLANSVLRHHRVRVPDSVVCPPGRKIRRPARLRFPIIVKTLYEEGSVGISQASIVHDDEHFQERVAFIHANFRQPAIADQYVDGRELYAALLGNGRTTIFPLRELFFEGLPSTEARIASYKVKWDEQYRIRWQIRNGPAAAIDPPVLRRIHSMCRRAARALQIDGYARLDLRLNEAGQPYLIEANPNPFLAVQEDFARSAHAAGVGFDRLVDRIIRLGEQRHLAVHGGKAASPPG